jgi:uncharacterized protein YfaP (DUF2135 family)
MTQIDRIEELENALERLLECFDTNMSQYADGDGGTYGRPWIEVEIDNSIDLCSGSGDKSTITEGQVNQTTADAIEFASEVLYEDHEVWGGTEEY